MDKGRKSDLSDDPPSILATVMANGQAEGQVTAILESIPDGFQVLDINRKRADEALRRSQAQLEAELADTRLL